MAFELTSPNFQEGESIPTSFTCDGNEQSPELTWTEQPGPTQSFILLMHDPDAPKGDFTHWVLWDIPGETQTLPKGAPLHSIGVAGKNSFDKLGYGGPCPPPGHGPHHYHFTLYALDIASLDLPEGSPRSNVEAAMRSHILEQSTLMGLFERKEGSSPPR